MTGLLVFFDMMALWVKMVALALESMYHFADCQTNKHPRCSVRADMRCVKLTSFRSRGMVCLLECGLEVWGMCIQHFL